MSDISGSLSAGLVKLSVITRCVCCEQRLECLLHGQPGQSPGTEVTGGPQSMHGVDISNFYPLVLHLFYRCSDSRVV